MSGGRGAIVFAQLIHLFVFSLAMGQSLDLIGKADDWSSGIDQGATKMLLSVRNGVVSVDINTDGGTEDYPKIRRTFANGQDWRPYARLRVKVKVTCDDPNILYKPIALVFYDEHTRLLDHPEKPMKQQTIWRNIPVGQWMELVEWLTEIRRAAIRQFDVYLYELPPSKPHKVRWEVARLELEKRVGDKSIVFDGVIFSRSQFRGGVSKSVGKISTKDRLDLSLGKGGNIVEISVKGKVLGRGSKETPTGLLVRDVTRYDEPPRMVGGVVMQKGQEIYQQAKMTDLGLKVSVVYKTVGDWLEISGRVSNLRKDDRAVTVYFALPVSKGRWHWWDSVAVSRTEPDETGELHYLERGMGYGLNGSHSKYPLGTLTLPDDGGLVLAIRMDEPAVHRIAYNASLQVFYIAVDLGLVDEKRTDGSSLLEAPFRFLLYRCDPDWGFRSALQRYYDFFPQFFAKRVRREGGWYVWGNMADTEKALEAGFAFHWGPNDSKAVRWDNDHNTLALFYIEPQTYQQSHQDFEEEPTYGDVLARLGKLANGDPAELERVAQTPYCVYPLAYTADDLKDRMKETTRVVLRSLNLNDFGHPHVVIDRPPWMRNRWGATLSCNLSPTLPEGKGQFNIQKVILPAVEQMEKEGAHYDGLALDSLGGHGDLRYVNSRREHFRFSQMPLSFSATTLQPVQVAFFTTVEWLRELVGLARQRGWVLMANCSWGITPGWLTFAAPYLDIFGAEHPYFTDPDFIRAIAYQKPCTDLPYDPRPEWEVRRHLLHAIFPGHGNDVLILCKYAPLLKELAKAGWQPITGARPFPDHVQLERFGTGQHLYIVAHNPQDQPVDATVRLVDRDLRSRRISAVTLPERHPLAVEGDAIRVHLSERDTAVISLTAE